MRIVIASLAILFVAACASPGEPDAAALKTLSPSQLTGQLATLNHPMPGVDPFGDYSGFMGDGAGMEVQAGLLGYASPDNHYVTTPSATDFPPAIELVRLGVGALPALLRCLGDKRPSGYVVVHPRTADLGASDYDPRQRPPPPPPAPPYDGELPPPKLKTSPGGGPPGDYTVKVADICYALIGQIVDRRLEAVRYQPTMVQVINSPIETPQLARLARADWTGLTAKAHGALLMDDLARASDADMAAEPLRRLRFYYPAAYAALAGDNLAKRRAFEAAEKAAAEDNAAIASPKP